MITIQQINQFREQAKKSGKTDAEIDSFINQKLQGQQQAPFSPLPQHTVNPIQSAQGHQTPNLTTAPQIVKETGKGFLKGVGSTLSNLETLGQKGLDAIAKPVVEGFTGKPYQPVKTAEQAFGDSLKPTNAAQKLGYYGEQLGEFFVPAGEISEATKFLEGTKLADKLAEGGKLANIARVGLTKSLPEAIGAYGVSKAQGGADAGTNAAIAAAVPIVGKGLSILSEHLPSIPTIGSLASGLKKDTLERVYKLSKTDPALMDKVIQQVESNPQQPFYNLANTIAKRLTNRFEGAKIKYTDAVSKLSDVLGTRGYDVSTKLTDFAKVLSDHNLGLKLTKTATETKSGFIPLVKVVANKQTPFISKELNVIEDLLNTVNQSKKITLQDVIDLTKKFSRAYDAVPYSNTGNPVQYHALVKQLEDTFNRVAENAVPGLKEVNQEYAPIKSVYDQFKNKFLSPDGELKQGAEQYLSNLHNLNKGAERTAINKLEEVLGIPIKDNVILLKDAKELLQMSPPTGSRTWDILRSLGIKGVGGAVGGIAGSFAGPVGTGVGSVTGAASAAAATSPKAVGNLIMKAGKLSNKLPKVKIPAGTAGAISKILSP